MKHSYEHVKSFIEGEGYTLLSDSYENARKSLLVKCNNGHEYNVLFCNFKNGQRCKICEDNKLKLTYEHVKSFIESEGYTLLSDSYENSREKLLIECNNGHEYRASFNTFQQGKRCPICNEKSSKAEKDIQLFVESLGVSVIRNDRTQITNPLTGHNLELDVWIPELNKAIEYNGSYWHSVYERVLNNDSIKKEQCKQKGINLLIVNEENWLVYNEVEQLKIRNFING